MGGSPVQGQLRDIAPADLILIETLRLAADGPVRLPFHLARLAAGCRAFGITMPDVAGRIAAVPRDGAMRLRLTVDLAGHLDLATAPFVPETRDWRVRVAPGRLDPRDPFRGFKTNQRRPYDTARAGLPPGIDEAILLNDRGEVADGTITNVFVPGADGWLTPPVSSGCLPGALRAELIATGRAREAVLRPADLARGLMVGNSLRGLIAAHLA